MHLPFKKAVRTILPKKVVAKLQLIRTSNRFDKIYKIDSHRFRRHHAHSSNLGSSQIESRLIFHAHAIEKGLSHDEIRLGFGKGPLSQLSKYMIKYKELEPAVDSVAYENALSTLQEYIHLHQERDYNVDFLSDIFPEELLEEIISTKSKIGGSRQVYGRHKFANSSKNFEELFNGRSSVREYSNIPLDLDDIDRAIGLAIKSPSVCNRQSVRVRIVEDGEAIQESLKLQGGFRGYPAPPGLLAITSDLSYFFSETERNQPYIDGGLFAMSLLLALEHLGIAACPLNAMLSSEREKSIRRLLSIADNEVLIMFISIGNFKDITNVPSSFRYSGQQISKRI